jgi:hypothetical protein
MELFGSQVSSRKHDFQAMVLNHLDYLLTTAFKPWLSDLYPSLALAQQNIAQVIIL